MNITPALRSITEYHLALSEADAHEAVESPYVFADRLAEQLRAVGVAPKGNGKPGRKPKPESHIKLGRGRKPAKASRPNGKGGLSCTLCSTVLTTQGFFNRHMKQKHGVTVSTASDAPSASTD